jgi:hypothetical protein
LIDGAGFVSDGNDDTDLIGVRLSHGLSDGKSYQCSGSTALCNRSAALNWLATVSTAEHDSYRRRERD